jgi:malonate-semialdehyde dehydrogenase (acetylating)/methylmalonate-semialdehyde dehydrogenase
MIYNESGHLAREFVKRTDGAMVGINVGIPVPPGVVGFAGHKQSFFGDLHCMGREGFLFYTETKNVTSRWFTGTAIPAKFRTWDGTMARESASSTKAIDFTESASGECPRYLAHEYDSSV